MKSRSKSRKRKSSKKKSPRKEDGKKIGRFHIKSVTNINNNVLTELKKMTRDAKLKYMYNIDFTKEKEFQDILKSENLSDVKFKLNKYIDLVQKSILHPKKQTEDFRQNYLKKLLNLKEKLNNIMYLPQKYPIQTTKNPLNILSPIYENESDLPFIMRQSSYDEDEPYLKNGNIFFKHKTNPYKQRFYWKDNKYFDIEYEDEE